MSELKKTLKTVRIGNLRGFDNNLQSFLDDNPNVEIKHIIVHQPYDVSLIYEADVSSDVKRS